MTWLLFTPPPWQIVEQMAKLGQPADWQLHFQHENRLASLLQQLTPANRRAKMHALDPQDQSVVITDAA